MTPTTLAAAHPADALFRSDRFPHILCPGCGIGSAMHALAQAMLESGISLDRHVCVSGIGCSSRVPGYLNIDSYHTTHGRSIPFATGLALAKPDLEVTVFAGDGDLFSIGGNHFIHAARRNVDLNVICINNFNYGMTGGQVGPTTPLGAKGTTAPLGNQDQPFNLPQLAAAVGAIFVARWTTLHVRQLKEAIKRTMRKRGFCFIEVLSPCPTSFGRPNDIGEGLEEMEAYQRRCHLDHRASLADLDINLLDENCPIIIGNFIDVERAPLSPRKQEPDA
jgi:2-oxoglutarate/2-oxoacid ferredoxin oxidoreductase subunit beta